MAEKSYEGLFRVLPFLLFLGNLSTALKLTNLSALPIVDPRQDMELHCQFDMGIEELYQVKWYKDDHEFYRFTPLENNKVDTYQVEGVTVDVAKSRCNKTRCEVVLSRPRRPYSSGAYRCEVSSGAPAFRLASQTQTVIVAALPREMPRITGLKNTYAIGELINAQCTSGAGDPRPVLTWYIDTKQIPSKAIRYESTLVERRINLTTTISHMQHQVGKLPPNKYSTILQIICQSSVEGIPSTLAPPLTTTSEVMVVDPSQMVDNQKLHSPYFRGSAARNSVASLAIVYMSVMILC